ncbi:hypothetical protein L915_14624, partial [Phytophthora nicotianae]
QKQEKPLETQQTTVATSTEAAKPRDMKEKTVCCAEVLRTRLRPTPVECEEEPPILPSGRETQAPAALAYRLNKPWDPSLSRSSEVTASVCVTAA